MPAFIILALKLFFNHGCKNKFVSIYFKILNNFYKMRENCGGISSAIRIDTGAEKRIKTIKILIEVLKYLIPEAAV